MSEQLIQFPVKEKPDCVKESAGFTWKPTEYRYPQGLARAVEESTPSNEQLLRLAAIKTPPPEWSQSTDNPFKK